MALEVVWSIEAEEGLDEIINYFEEHWTDREINKFFVRLEECLNRIREAPNRYKDSLRKPGTKEFQHSPQTTIFYTFNSKTVNILFVWANLKDPSKLKK